MKERNLTSLVSCENFQRRSESGINDLNLIIEIRLEHTKICGRGKRIRIVIPVIRRNDPFASRNPCDSYDVLTRLAFVKDVSRGTMSFVPAGSSFNAQIIE